MAKIEVVDFDLHTHSRGDGGSQPGDIHRRFLLAGKNNNLQFIGNTNHLPRHGLFDEFSEVEKIWAKNWAMPKSIPGLEIVVKDNQSRSTSFPKLPTKSQTNFGSYHLLVLASEISAIQPLISLLVKRDGIIEQRTITGMLSKNLIAIIPHPVPNGNRTSLSFNGIAELLSTRNGDLYVGMGAATGGSPSGYFDARYEFAKRAKIIPFGDSDSHLPENVAQCFTRLFLKPGQKINSIQDLFDYLLFVRQNPPKSGQENIFPRINDQPQDRNFLQRAWDHVCLNS